MQNTLKYLKDADEEFKKVSIRDDLSLEDRQKIKEKVEQAKAMESNENLGGYTFTGFGVHLRTFVLSKWKSQNIKKNVPFINVLYTNCDSMSNKKEEFLHILHEENPDITVVTEINPKNASYKFTPTELNIQNYDLFTNIENVENNRGILILCKIKLKAKENDTTTKFQEIVSIELDLEKSDKLLIAAIYRRVIPCQVGHWSHGDTLRFSSNFVH